MIHVLPLLTSSVERRARIRFRPLARKELSVVKKIILYSPYIHHSRPCKRNFLRSRSLCHRQYHHSHSWSSWVSLLPPQGWRCPRRPFAQWIWLRLFHANEFVPCGIHQRGMRSVQLWCADVLLVRRHPHTTKWFQDGIASQEWSEVTHWCWQSCMLNLSARNQFPLNYLHWQRIASKRDHLSSQFLMEIVESSFCKFFRARELACKTWSANFSNAIWGRENHARHSC